MKKKIITMVLVTVLSLSIFASSASASVKVWISNYGHTSMIYHYNTNFRHKYKLQHVTLKWAKSHGYPCTLR